MKKLTKNRKAIFALVLAALLFAIALFAWPALAGTRLIASADGGSSPGPGEPDPQPTYTKLYYFSDNPDSERYVDYVLPQYLSQVGLDESDIEYHYWPLDARNYLETFIPYVNNVCNVQNAYVIFEMKNTYPRQDKDREELYVNQLKSIFRRWKDNNCKLMVIWGTDENRLYGYTKFLSYADVQVNTDVFYSFLWSMYDLLEEDLGGSIYDKINLLSPFWSKYWSGEYEDNIYKHDLFSGYLIPEYRAWSRSNGVSLPANNLRYGDAAVWNYMNANHNFWRWDEYDVGGWDTLADAGVNAQWLVGLGHADWGDAYAEWEECISQMREDCGWDFPVFIFNDWGVPVADWVDEGTPEDNVYYSGDIAAILDDYIPEIMKDFILGNDLTQYDNWESASPVCFKPMFPGEDGWMKNPGPRLATKLIMDSDNAEYFWGPRGGLIT